MDERPRHLQLTRDEGLTIEWSDGATSFYPVAHLRRLSPSAESRQLREALEANPLTVLPPTPAGGSEGSLRLLDASFVGRYAVRLIFSDGHDTGLYTWSYLRSIDPAVTEATS